MRPLRDRPWLWGAVGILIVWGLVAASQGKAGLPPIRAGSTSDLVMYRAITARVAAGEPYYRVLSEELPARGYAIRPVFNWRLPTLTWLNTLPPARVWGRVLLALVGIAVIVLWLVVIKKSIPTMVPWSVPVLLLGTAPLLTMDASIDFYEVWAGLLIAASLACRGLGAWRWSLALGAAALSVRELSLFFVLIMAGVAWYESHRREAAAWLASVAAFVVFWTWHVSHVLAVMPAQGLENSWAVAGGWPFVLEASHASIFLMLFPGRIDPYLGAILVPLAWAGSWYWKDTLGRRLALVLTGYFGLFMIVGRPDNWYWGFVVAPLIPIAAFGDFFGCAHGGRPAETGAGVRAGFWSNARLVTTAALLITAATAPVPAQDWIPFQVAGRLAPAGEWQALRLPQDATSLLDVTPRYREVARTIVSKTGDPAFPDSMHTAFVSPPPAALAVAPLSRLSWPADVVAWRLLLAVPVVLALLLVGVAAHEPGALARWSWICLAATPLLWYAVHTGQPSAWLFVAAVVTVLPPSPGRDWAGGLALGLGVIFKATPVLVVVGLWFCGRRRLAAIAAAVTIAACVSTVPFGGGAWMDFAGSSKRLATVVISDWNNASFDAALVRLSAGTTNVFSAPGMLVAITAWLMRLAVLGFAVRLALDVRRGPTGRAAAVWIGWLAATPLLWLHYLAVVVPLAGTTPVRRLDPGVILMAAIGAVVAGRVAGAPSGLVGTAGCIAWLACAMWLLSNRCWNPEWRRFS